VRFKKLEDVGIALGPVLLVLLMLSIPLSPTARDTFLALGSLVLISTPYYRRISYYTWNSLCGRLAIGLFAFVILASLWSPASYEAMFWSITKYFKLFYLPIVAVAFIKPNMRWWAINAYLAGMFITAVLSLLEAHGIYLLKFSGDPGEVFFNHIITSFMMAFAIYLCGLYFAQSSSSRARVLYGFLFIFMSYQILFVNTGRMGYVVYSVLMILLLIQQLEWRRALVGISVFVGLLVFAYNFSPTLNLQLNSLRNDVVLFNQNQMQNSVGFRMEFHQYARSLLAEKPLLGNGTASFEYRFRNDKPIPSWGSELKEPHSQYWLTLAEQGLIGFSLLLGFLISTAFTSLKLKQTRPILLGFVLIFSIACLSDTILCYSVLGYLLVMVIAICFGEIHEMRESRAQVNFS